MRVALLFYGQPRFVDNLEVYNNYKSIISKYNTDIFCHTWWSNDNNEFKSSSWSNINYTSNINAIDKIKKLYNPLEFIYDEPINFKSIIFFKLQEKFNNDKFLTEQNFNNTLSQLYSIKRVSEIFVPHKDKYDFIILARYDTIITNFPDINVLNKNTFYLAGEHDSFPDMINIFGTNFLEYSLNIFDDVDTIYDKIENIYPEQFKYKSFLKRFSNTDMVGIPMRAFAIRS